MRVDLLQKQKVTVKCIPFPNVFEATQHVGREHVTPTWSQEEHGKNLPIKKLFFQRLPESKVT